MKVVLLISVDNFVLNCLNVNNIVPEFPYLLVRYVLAHIAGYDTQIDLHL